MSARDIVMAAAGAVSTPVGSTDWTRRDPIPYIANASSFYGRRIAYSSALGVYAVVTTGATGTNLLTSSDGITWTSSLINGAISVANSGVVWGNGLFVVFGSAGAIYTSPNGIDWTVRTSGTTNNIADMEWSGSLFVGVASSGTILTSPNGITWTVQVSGSSGALAYVAWSGSAFVVTMGSLTVLRSTDGVNWTSISTGVSPITAINGIAWGNGKFIAGGNAGYVATSSDGITWVAQIADATTTPSFGKVYWQGSYFVASATAGSGTLGSLVYKSTDGVAWSLTATNYPYPFTGYVYASGKLIAVYNSMIAKSTDATDWASVYYVSFLNGYSSAYAPTLNRRIAFSSSGQGYLTSTDGINWVPRGWIGAQTAYWGMQGICWDGSRFVAVGTSGRMLASGDGLNWSFLVSITATQYGVAYVPWLSLYISVGVPTKSINTSPNGTAWTTRITAGQFYQAAASNSIVVVVGANGQIYSSTDGITWTLRASGTTQWLYGLAWSGSMFVAVGAAGTILTSPDGVTWTARTSGTTTRLTGCCWAGNMFLVSAAETGASTGAFLSSPDGITWTPQTFPQTTSGSNNAYYSIMYDGTRAIAAGIGILTNP